MNEIIIGTRGSRLALWQAEHVANRLKEHTDVPVKLEKIKTTGDKILDAPLSKIGDKGLFVKEIEQALLDEKIHLAVHSMKDMPTALPDGLVIAAALEREDPRDALISEKYSSITEFGKDTVVGTSSLRRQAQLLNIYPRLKIVDVRGNLDTRLDKLKNGLFDAIILAGAGVRRLGYHEKIRQLIPKTEIMPAVGQGAIAIEIKSGNEFIASLVDKINHNDTLKCVTAERSLMKQLEGGCQVPIGASATISGGKLDIEGIIASLDGSKLLMARVGGDAGDAEKLGTKLAENLIQQGAGKILEEVREFGMQKSSPPVNTNSNNYDH